VTDTDNNEILQTLTSGHRPTLVAIDFSDDSRAAALWAGAFAGRVGGDLVVLHVVHDPAAGPGYYRTDDETQLQPMERAAERMLDTFVADLQRDHPEVDSLARAGKTLVSGLPAGRIVEIADLLNAKLIVIGSRGMTGLPHLLQGSVSERVVKLANRPVVVIRARGNKRRDEKSRKEQEKKRRKSIEKEE
jgi:nucleotide-binding universal stress UspA family protein